LLIYRARDLQRAFCSLGDLPDAYPSHWAAS
jgi:hypothetical protein